MPFQFAVAAEVRGAAGTVDALRVAMLTHGAQFANGFAARSRAPRATLVQFDLCGIDIATMNRRGVCCMRYNYDTR